MTSQWRHQIRFRTNECLERADLCTQDKPERPDLEVISALQARVKCDESPTKTLAAKWAVVLQCTLAISLSNRPLSGCISLLSVFCVCLPNTHRDKRRNRHNEQGKHASKTQQLIEAHHGASCCQGNRGDNDHAKGHPALHEWVRLHPSFYVGRLVGSPLKSCRKRHSRKQHPLQPLAFQENEKKRRCPHDCHALQHQASLLLVHDGTQLRNDRPINLCCAPPWAERLAERRIFIS